MDFNTGINQKHSQIVTDRTDNIGTSNRSQFKRIKWDKYRITFQSTHFDFYFGIMILTIDHKYINV